MIYICLNELRQILAKKMQPLADREYKQSVSIALQ
jgi:hypothetical protein